MIRDVVHENITPDQLQQFRTNYDKVAKVGIARPFTYHRDWDYAMAICNTTLRMEDIVLEIGCACSYFVFYLALGVKIVYGIDAIYASHTFEATAWLSTLRDYEAYNDGKVQVIVQNAKVLAFPDNFFDKVFTFSVLEHFNNNDDILCAGEVFRCLKPGGEFLGTVDYNPLSEHPHLTDPSCRAYTYESFCERIIQSTGFKLVGEVHLAPVPKCTDYIVAPLFFRLVK
jgi:SAM-dependent methyltransferase